MIGPSLFGGWGEKGRKKREQGTKCSERDDSELARFTFTTLAVCQTKLLPFFLVLLAVGLSPIYNLTVSRLSGRWSSTLAVGSTSCPTTPGPSLADLQSLCARRPDELSLATLSPTRLAATASPIPLPS